MENKKTSPSNENLKTAQPADRSNQHKNQKRKKKSDRRQMNLDRRLATRDRRLSLVGYRNEFIDVDQRNPATLDRRAQKSKDRRGSAGDRRTPSDRFRFLKKILITGGYLGYSPYMPGTIASASVVLVYGLLLWTLPFMVVQIIHILAMVVALGAGYGLAGYAIRVLFKTPDPKPMVLDEIAGMWISLIPFLYISPDEVTWLRLSVYLGVAFVMFRVLDIFKPGLIGRLDKRYESHFVMNDDIVSGVITALLVHLFIHL